MANNAADHSIFIRVYEDQLSWKANEVPVQDLHCWSKAATENGEVLKSIAFTLPEFF